jgi:hypothetical protein
MYLEASAKILALVSRLIMCCGESAKMCVSKEAKQ